MKRTKEVIKLFILLFITSFFVTYNVVLADVGSFESYDSGSSWSSSSSSSSWDRGSSWSSSSSFWDSDSSWSGDITAKDIIISILMISFFVGLFIWAYYKTGYLNIWHIMPTVNSYPTGSTYPTRNNYTTKLEEDIENEIKAIDELFNKEEFLAWTRDLFVKLQNAWTDRDWSTIRTFETNELFEQHQKQLQGYIDRGQINVMERICVRSASLIDFSQTGDKDVLAVKLSSKMIDYIIDENTKQVIKGDKVTDRYSTYKLVFIRKTGIKTQAGSNKISTTNCPNCGAPTQITSSGKCEYCGSVITTGAHNWVLSNLEKIG